MKKLFISYFALILIVGFAGCKKNESPNEIIQKIDIGEKVKDFLIATGTPKDGLINIQAFKQAGSLIPQSQQPFDGYVGGTFYINKNNTKSTTVSKFRIDEVDIPYNNYAAYPGYGIQSNGNGSAVTNWMKNLFGKKIKISLEGSVLYRTNSEDSTFYVPEEITYEADFLQTYSYNANESHAITWQVDTQNPTGVLYVGIVYEAVQSNQFSQSMPDTSFIQAFLEIPDNGHYTITPDKVTGLPTNSFVSITLARGNYQVITDPATGTETLVYAITQTSTSSTIQIIR